MVVHIVSWVPRVQWHSLLTHGYGISMVDVPLSGGLPQSIRSDAKQDPDGPSTWDAPLVGDPDESSSCKASARQRWKQLGLSLWGVPTTIVRERKTPPTCSLNYGSGILASSCFFESSIVRVISSEKMQDSQASLSEAWSFHQFRKASYPQSFFPAIFDPEAWPLPRLCGDPQSVRPMVFEWPGGPLRLWWFHWLALPQCRCFAGTFPLQTDARDPLALPSGEPFLQTQREFGDRFLRDHGRNS